MIDITLSPIRAYSGKIPNKATQDKITFANNVEPYLIYVNDSFVIEFNQSIDKINNFIIEVNNTEEEIKQIRDEARKIKDRNEEIRVIVENNKSFVESKSLEIENYVIPQEATYSIEAINESLATIYNMMWSEKQKSLGLKII